MNDFPCRFHGCGWFFLSQLLGKVLSSHFGHLKLSTIDPMAVFFKVGEMVSSTSSEPDLSLNPMDHNGFKVESCCVFMLFPSQWGIVRNPLNTLLKELCHTTWTQAKLWWRKHCVRSIASTVMRHWLVISNKKEKATLKHSLDSFDTGAIDGMLQQD